jgi:hypothetical protein
VSIHGSRVFAAWVVDTLTDGGLAVALGEAPASVPANAGWGAVYPIAGGIVEGSLNEPNSDATPDVQVTSVAYQADQVLWHVDKVRELILAAVPADLSDGRRVTFVEPTWADPTLIRDDQKQPPTFYCPDRFTFRTAG